MSSPNRLEALVDGVRWRATALVHATSRSGILAIAGFDEAGEGIVLAMLAERLWRPQEIGRTPANAVLTIGGRRRVAMGDRGEGSLLLTSFAPDRATGHFEFRAEPEIGRDTAEGRRVTCGSFDVRL
jgi:hypothetical protein